jgi:hypothetical protein
MADFVIEIKGLQELQKKLGQPIEPHIQALTMGIGEELRKHLARYPGKVSYPIEWASDKQRRWYFANRPKDAKGDTIPYVRNSDAMSQRLGASWTTAKRGSMDAVVGNKATYAAMVQSDERQQPMHKKTGWITDKMAMAKVKASGVIGRLWRDTVLNLFRR